MKPYSVLNSSVAPSLTPSSLSTALNTSPVSIPSGNGLRPSPDGLARNFSLAFETSSVASKPRIFASDNASGSSRSHSSAYSGTRCRGSTLYFSYSAILSMRGSSALLFFCNSRTPRSLTSGKTNLSARFKIILHSSTDF